MKFFINILTKNNKNIAKSESMEIDRKNDMNEIPEEPIGMKKKIFNEDTEIIYQDLKNLSNDNLDLLMLKGKEFLDRSASGKNLHYFEKRISEIIDVIYMIKEERLSRKK